MNAKNSPQENFEYVSIEDYITRMLSYYDPLGFIEESSAPHDEYNMYIKDIVEKVFRENFRLKDLEDWFYNKFLEDFVDKEELKRKSLRMAEDLIWYKSRLKD